MKMKPQYFLIACFFLVATLLSFSNLRQSKNTVAYGSWRYKVKVKHSAMFNRDFFFNPNYKQKDLENISFYVGKEKVSPDAVFYTGYFKLNPDPTVSYEVIGGYYPSDLSNPVDYAPIKVVKSKKHKSGIWDMYWYSNFNEGNVTKLPVYWFVRANYDPKTDKIHGMTYAAKCENLKCEEINIVEWMAERVTDINYYSYKNHKLKPSIAAVLNFIDKSGYLNKTFLHDPRDTDQILGGGDYTNFLSSDYLNASLKAVVPAKAVDYTESNTGIQQICATNYCQRTAKWWEGGQSACNTATAQRKTECCNGSGGENGSCRCFLPANGNPASSSTICCKSTATCVKTTQTQNADGSTTFTKTETSRMLDPHTEVPRTAQGHQFYGQSGVGNVLGNFSGFPNYNLTGPPPMDFPPFTT